MPTLLAKSKWTSRQRDDLKTCPFCDTKALEQARVADVPAGTQWRIQCGNPFCLLECRTIVFAALKDAEGVWQERAPED